MPLWLVWGWREREPPYRRMYRALNADVEPCVTVTCSGIGGAGGSQFWLVESDERPILPEHDADRRR